MSLLAATAVRSIRWMAGAKRRTDGGCPSAAPMARRFERLRHREAELPRRSGQPRHDRS